MVKDYWQDPLLITEVSLEDDLLNRGIQSDPIQFSANSWREDSSRAAQMADLDLRGETIKDNFRQDQCSEEAGIEEEAIDDEGFSWRKKSSKTVKIEESYDILPNEAMNGPYMLGFSLTSPDLVICADSPVIPHNGSAETPDFIKNLKCGNAMVSSFELSLDKGIDGTMPEEEIPRDETPVTKISALFPELQASKQTHISQASIDLAESLRATDKFQNDLGLPIISINSGGRDEAVIYGGIDFKRDSYFVGGDVMRTEAWASESEGDCALYQSARVGNFSYKFESLEPGIYIVDLHFAEIIFTHGPQGMRVFDVFIQEEKVISDLDVYAQVGSHKPLILPDLKAFVNGKNGLSIRFEGVIGSPIVCGISVKRDSQAGFGSMEFLKERGKAQMENHELIEVANGSTKFAVVEELEKLQRDYELQHKELVETKKILESIRREHNMKNKECQEAWMSLRELQNELMRKSMHVGSLAYAIEGQVKEKSRWFSSLRDLSRKFKLLKMEHSKLSNEASEWNKGLADMTEMAISIQSTINHKVELEKEKMDLDKEHTELKLKFIEGANERKELYNKVLELKGNIRVSCRCRPLNSEEIAVGASMAIDFESAKDGELIVKANGAPKKVFKFDSIFSPQANQAEVFEDTAPFATSVLDGYNVCIFAYGQTGTGKTFTMEGTEEARGVNYRTLEELFRIMKDREQLYRYEISVSVLEVYNEQIRDLLLPTSQPGVAAKRLEIRQVAEGTHHVPGLVEARVSSMSEAWEVLQTGSNARAVGSTNANEHSSRSHCIHCVMVKGENLMNGECTRSKLWLVDLAGSERVAKTDVQGERLKEAQNINRSLSALGDVISSLANKSPHVPFRNSKLTHLLQDSLGGDSKALMFVQVSPNESDLSETLCSLNFASRVRGVELGPAKKQLDSSELPRYKQMAEKTKQEIKFKDGHIRKMEETIQGLELKVKTRDANNKNLQEKVKELESQLLVERKLARQHVDTKIAELQQQQQEEQIVAPIRPPLGALPLGGVYRNLNQPGTVSDKDDMNSIYPLAENSKSKPLMPTSLADNFNFKEKENKPEMAEQLQLPKTTGRLSICPNTQKFSEVQSRRNSLIPLPIERRLAIVPSTVSMLQQNTKHIKEVALGSELNIEQTWSEPTQRSATKKFSNIMRRSLQKKIQIKSPMQQMRRGGINGRLEKVRVSIGSRRPAQRMLICNATKGLKEMQLKQNQKGKEKGWNL
ncbi:hypothetical protein Sjap_026345 [Stephania japonica]|uniref:Kinesin motor domain-containing protein n=1 Tax=Stephania japonica TaxID=461633 RepID=A0AAP0HGD3_9MAGN